MKKLFLIHAFLFVILGCEKKDYVFWFDPESEVISLSETEYTKAADVAQKFSFNTFSKGCDDSVLKELMSYNGKEIKVYGLLGYSHLWESDVLYTTNGKYSLPLKKGIMDNLYHDSTIYYVTGVLNIEFVTSNSLFKKTKTSDEYDSTTIIWFEPIFYFSNKN